MATRKTNAEITQPEPLGKEGEVCAQCGTKLATDQRYCLNCGTARAEPRLDYERHLRGGGDAASADAKPGRSGAQWSPLLAVVAIAVLGVMLLLGVLIGQDDSNVTVTQVPASTAATTATETLPTTTPTPSGEGATTTPGANGATTVPNTSTAPDQQGAAKQGAGGISPTD